MTASGQHSPHRRWAAVAVTALLFAPGTQAQTAITDSNIALAADAWVNSPTTAAATYGNIVGWNTAAVTSMYQGSPTLLWLLSSVFAAPERCCLLSLHRIP
jgi:hypothetical protein